MIQAIGSEAFVCLDAYFLFEGRWNAKLALTALTALTL